VEMLNSRNPLNTTTRAAGRENAPKEDWRKRTEWEILLGRNKEECGRIWGGEQHLSLCKQGKENGSKRITTKRDLGNHF